MRPTALVAALLIASCATPEGGRAPAEPAPEPEPLELLEDWEGEGLEVRLSEAHPRAPGATAVAPAPERIEILDDEATAALLARAPALEAEEGDRQPVALRPATLPPPRTGATELVPFPPPDAGPPVPAVDEGPLRVLRHAPEGEVPMAPHLSVTFSQPMVALTSQDDAARTVPVTLRPEPEGQWRWVGTRTVLFEPDPRFPMATEYTVEVPAGTTSATGTALEEASAWTFSTPPVQVEHAWPTGGPHPVDPLIALRFDQRVDATAILPFVHLRARGAEAALRRATDAEVAEDDAVSAMVEAAEDGRTLVLAPVQPLRPDTTWRIEVDVGAPSAEGPRLTAERQSFDFETYPPLAVDDFDCAWGLDGCAPGEQLWAWMNNPLEDGQDSSGIVLDPPVEGLEVQVSGYGVTVHGDTPARSTVHLVLPATLRDQFGQTLGKEERLKYRIGSAPQSLQGPPREVVVLDPAAPPALSVWSTNHKKLQLSVFSASPEDYPKVSQWMREARYDGFRGPIPVPRLARQQVEVVAYAPDELVETALDLSPWLPAHGKGHLFVMVEPVPRASDPWDRVEVFAWVQRTEIGLTALVDYGEVRGWATSLRDGRPLEGVGLSLLGEGGEVRTGADGLGVLEPYASSESGPHALVARLGDDVALLPETTGWWNQYGGWVRSERGPALAWFTFDDRAMYRPGETVAVKGWVRTLDTGRGASLKAWSGAPTKLKWTAHDAWGNPMGEGEVEVGPFGGFELSLELPGTPTLGWANLSLTAVDPGQASNSTWVHRFQVQEFRRPEFEVSTSVDPRPYVLGEHAYATVDAGYYAGGPLPDAPVTWEVSWSDGTFSPPNRSEWTFGEAATGWGFRGWGGLLGYWGSGEAPERSATLEGHTGALGQHTLKVDFLALSPPVPQAVHLQATVEDVNRQRWTASDDLVLHPAALYAGLRTDNAFYEEGDPVAVQVLVVDLEGAAVADVPVHVTLERMEWKRVDGTWQEVPAQSLECDVTSEDEGVGCDFEPPEGGSWRATATLTDAEGRASRTRTTVWVSGWDQPPQRAVALEDVQLVLDAEDYQPGDTARLLVVTPFTPASGLLTVHRDGLMGTTRFEMAESTTTLEIPITEAHTPGAWLQVDLVGAAVRVDDAGEPLPDKARRVAYAQGGVDLVVPPLAHTLAVSVTPAEAATEPGASTSVAVLVRDARGQPVRAEVAVVVVDEAVLALSGYATPDPLTAFYARRGSGVAAYHARSMVVLADPLAAQEASEQGLLEGLNQVGYLDDVTGLGALGTRGGGGMFPSGSTTISADEPMAPMESAGEMEVDKAARSKAPARRGLFKALSTEQAPQPVAVREDFTATALFAPHVMTDASGAATVPLDLPDSLTRYRVMAVAVDAGVAFGAGESTLTARLPLMLRPSPPRFLSFGDRAELPLVVQNQTDAPLEVDLALAMTNALAIPGVDHVPLGTESRRAGRTLTVPAHDRREVRIPIAADMAGTARFQAVVAAGKASDAASFEFPVWTPATAEAFAVYGEIDAGAIVQPVQAPPDAWPQIGGLEVTTSSTQLAALTDAVIYLAEYPYDCSEQIASRVLALAALRDVLDAFEAEQLQSPEELEAAVVRDLARLERRQLGHGGWGFWPGGRDDPYVTGHAVHAMVRARDKGYEVPEVPLSRGLAYLERARNHIPWWYSDEAEWTVRAYALYVRHLAGDTDAKQARELYAEAGLARLPLEAQGWLAPVLHASGDAARVDALVRNWENKAAETAAGAEFAAAYTDTHDYVLLHSSRRTDAVLLESLILVRPEHDLIPKVVRALLGHRVAGRWGSTQENSLVLLAMDRYFRVYEAVEPDFVARVWLGEDYAGDHTFRGRTTERAHTLVPMGMLTDPPGPRDLVVAVEGEGRLYYRLGLRYAPRDLRLEPADRGFEVSRVYEAVDDPADVRRDEDGTWHIAAGARVRARLTMVVPGRRTHVALVDPLPGGLEPMNPDLAVTGAIPEDPNAQQADRYWWWSRPWYEHQNLRDERVEAFTTLLWAGVHEYTYVATATTPGRYVVAPPRAEEMYHTETSGRGASDLVWVE